MKLRCDRAELFERLQSIAGIVGAAPPARPICQCTRLEAARVEGVDTLTLEVTDLDIASRLIVERVEVDEPGVVVLPASKLTGLVREFPGTGLQIATGARSSAGGRSSGDEGSVSESSGFRDDGSVGAHRGVELSSETYHFRLLGEDPEEFPRVPRFEAASALELPREKFVEMARRVAVAACRDSSRYQLTGVFFEVDGDRLSATATDGKRLAHDSIRIQNPGGMAAAAIVPNRAVDVIVRVLGRGADFFRFVLTDTEIQIALDHGEITAKLVEGTFPDYSSALPPEPNTRARAVRNDLLAAARSASLTTDKDTATILFRFEEDRVALESQAKQIGESRIEVPATVEGEALAIRFNPALFMDALRTLNDEEVRLEFSGANRPATIRGPESYRHYLMPLVVA